MATSSAHRTVTVERLAPGHDRLCTVGRTVEAGPPIATRVE